MALPEGTVTFLFSDVEGSTQLARQLGDRYAGVLADHLRVLRTAFGERGGHEIDTQGDSLFVAFPRAKDAVLAAAAAQRALAEHAWPDGCELRVRMGLHTGEAVVTDDRYLGVAVHHAARICAAAVLEDDPLDGIQLRGLGHHQLKDFDRPERIFQLVIHGLRAEFPPLRAQHHLGRLIDHVHLRVRNLEASKRFYGAVLEALGHELSGEGEGYFSADELFASDDGEPTAHLHLAFQARDRETVDAFYEAALAAGGRDNGAPGERRYHPGYYAAYVLDPDDTETVLELSAATLDVARALDRPKPARCRRHPRGDRARRPDAVHRRRRDLARSRRGPRPELHLVGAVDPVDPDRWYVSVSTGPFAAHGDRDPQARIYRRRADEPSGVLAGGLPEPLPAMPYALVATDGRLLAGLADGQIWESGDRGDTWRACVLHGGELTTMQALAWASA